MNWDNHDSCPFPRTEYRIQAGHFIQFSIYFEYYKTWTYLLMVLKFLIFRPILNYDYNGKLKYS